MHILEGKHTMRIQIFTFAPLSNHALLDIGQIEQRLASWVPTVIFYFEDTGEAVMTEPQDVAMDEFVEVARKSRKLGAEMLVAIESDFENNGDVLYIVAHKHAAEPYWFWLEGAGCEDVASHLSDDDPDDDLVAHAAARYLYWNGCRHELLIPPAQAASA